VRCTQLRSAAAVVELVPGREAEEWVADLEVPVPAGDDFTPEVVAAPREDVASGDVSSEPPGEQLATARAATAHAAAARTGRRAMGTDRR